jgi:ATP-dependent Clp protease ATP-binding subunit ClpB
LFDEFEKADPAVGKILLQVLDQGRVEDTEGHALDFGETFIIFTSNAGCVYGGPSAVGFAPRMSADAPPRVDPRLLWEDLRRLGLGPEFEGRIHHQFFFAALDQHAIRHVVDRHLKHLADVGTRRGWRLEWDTEAVDVLVLGWQPHLGARDIIGVVRTKVEEELRLAGAERDLTGIDVVRLVPILPADARGNAADSRAVRRWRSGTTLYIAVA